MAVYRPGVAGGGGAVAIVFHREFAEVLAAAPKAGAISHLV